MLSSGKGTWGQVAGLINRGKWDKVILIVDDFFKKSVSEFEFAKKAEIISINFNENIRTVIQEIKEKLKNKINGTEVALSIASGSGRDHMVLISALLQLPVGIKFVALTREGIVEL